jgi:hypothetical protein
MGQLDRNALLKKEILKIEKVELGNEDYVYITQMTGRERDDFEQSLIKKIKDGKGQITGFEQMTENFRAKLAVFTVCDEAGKLLFLPSDYMKLSESISAAKLEKIVNAAQKLNAITEEDKENLVKNSSAGPEDNSNSGSVEN